MDNRYARQIQVKEIGLTGQQSLSNANVVVIGMGGLGCHIATLLAGAGIGKLRVLDHDRVSLSNLHRQTLYRESDIGQLKVRIAQTQLQALNKDISVQATAERLAPGNVQSICDGADLVIDAADNFAVSYLLSDACMEQQTPLISASVNRTFGYVGLFCNGAPSLRAVFPKIPNETTSCDTVGVTGPSVAIIAGIQSQEAIKLLIGKPSLSGKLLYFDMWNYSLQTIDISGAKEPQHSRIKLIDANSISNADYVIDVRTHDEIHKSPQSFNVDLHRPLEELIENHGNLSEKRIVIACVSGQRAMLAAQTLISNAYQEVSVVLPTTSAG